MMCACLLLAGAMPIFSAWADDANHRVNDPVNDQLSTIEQTESRSRAERDTLAKTAAALATEIEGLRRQSITAAEAMQRHEAALTMLEGQLSALSLEENRKAAELKQEEQERGGLLMALVELARNPPEALALASPDPVTAERSALLLGHAVPAIDQAAHRLGRDLQQLAALRLAIAQAQERHRAEQGSLDSQKSQLNALISRKSALQRQAQQGVDLNDEKMVALAAEAANLKDLIERLDAAKQQQEAAPRPATRVAMANVPVWIAPIAKPPATAMPPKPQQVAAPAVAPRDPSKPPKLRSFLYAPGNYLVPAAGTLVHSYGKADPMSGMTSRGLTYETRGGARVVAPYYGRILFAGPFRGYSQILIIEHGDGYHSLLAGLARLDVTVGQWLVAGEPVGIMPEGEEKPRLYLELRHDGQPINPLPWLATSNEKVSG